MTWVHSCVAIDSALNHLTVVVNGKKLEDKAFPIPAGEQPPSNLTGKLLISKLSVGIWMQSKNKVSNVNIFSKRLTLPEMMRRTAGDDCGKADGDYLAWESAEWDLKGKASFSEVTVEDLCRRGSEIQIFTAPEICSLHQCSNLCEKIRNGTMTRVRTPIETQEFFDRMNENLKDANGGRNPAGQISQSAWIPIHKEDDGSWVDIYNKDPVKEIAWAAGQPKGTSECAIFVISWKGLGVLQCHVPMKEAFPFCPCSFPVHPHLTLRGLCPDSHIDQAYLARNDPVTGFLYFYGSRGVNSMKASGAPIYLW